MEQTARLCLMHRSTGPNMFTETTEACLLPIKYFAQDASVLMYSAIKFQDKVSHAKLLQLTHFVGD